MLYDRNIIGTSSEIFGCLRQSSVIFGKCSENVRRRSSSLRYNFGKSSEIFGKSSKTSLLVCLYNKQNNTWTLGDMEFIFECSHRYRTSERSERVRYRMWTREDKFHISKRPCIILYLLYKHQWNTRWAFARKHIFTREDNMISSHVKVTSCCHKS